MARLLVAGCGYVGIATADLFQDAGWEVEGWTHSAESATQLADKPYAVCPVDITSAEAVTAAAKTFDAVIHCASSGGGGAESYRRVYLQGAQNLLAVLQSPTLLYTSSTSVYAQTEGEWVDEESAAEPTHETGVILRETEELVIQNGGMVARLAGIYGPGRSALLRKFRFGEARIEAGRERYLNQVHRDDIAAALFLLANLSDKQSPSASIFNVVDNEPITERACYEWLAMKLSRPVPPVSASPRTGKRGVSNKRVSNAKLRGLGWAPRFPTFAIGMENSVLPAAIQAAEF